MPNIKKIVVSGSSISQLFNDAGYLASAGGGIVSSSTQTLAHLNSTGIVSSSAQIDSLFNIDGLISSSAQIAQLGAGILSSSAQLTSEFDTRYLNTTGDGVISSSAQLTSEFDTRYLNTTGDGILSSSAQIAVEISGAFTAVSGGLANRLSTLETQGSTNAQTASFVNSNDVEFLGATENQTLTAVSTSIASRATTLEGSGTIQGVGTTNNVTFASVTTTADVTVGGNLYVNGTTTTLNTTNLNIEDKFLLLNSGSTGPSYEGGIIVESGSTGTGNAFYYDASDNRWALKGGLVATNTSAVAAEAFMSVAIVDTLANAQSGSYYKAGNIIVDNQDIYIVTV